MFFKKELFITRDLDKYNKITALLTSNNIKCTCVTNSPTNTGRHHGVPFIKSEASYEYRIFVSRKDYIKAKQLVI